MPSPCTASLLQRSRRANQLVKQGKMCIPFVICMRPDSGDASNSDDMRPDSGHASDSDDMRPDSGDVRPIETMEELKSHLNNAGSNKLVVLMFWAPWSITSLCMKQPFKELAKTSKKGAADFYTLDVEKSTQVATFYKIEALPTFVLLRGNPDKILGMIAGIDEDELRESIEEALHELQEVQEEHLESCTGV